MSKSALFGSFERSSTVVEARDYWDVIFHRETPEEDVPLKRRKEWTGGRIVRNPFELSILGSVEVVVIDAFSVLFSPGTSYDFSERTDPSASLFGRRGNGGSKNPTFSELAQGFVRVFAAMFSARKNLRVLVLSFEKADAVTVAKRKEQFLRSSDDDAARKLEFSHVPASIVGASWGEPDYFAALKDRPSRREFVHAVGSQIERALVSLKSPLREGRHSVVLDFGRFRWLLSAGLPSPTTGGKEEEEGEKEEEEEEKVHYVRGEETTLLGEEVRWLGEADDSLAYLAIALASHVGASTSPVLEVLGNDADFAPKAFVAAAVSKARNAEFPWTLYVRQYGGAARHRLWMASGVFPDARSLTGFVVGSLVKHGNDYVSPTDPSWNFEKASSPFVVDYSRGLVVPKRTALLEAVLEGWTRLEARARTEEEALALARKAGSEDTRTIEGRWESIPERAPLEWMRADVEAFFASDSSAEGWDAPTAFSSAERASGREGLARRILALWDLVHEGTRRGPVPKTFKELARAAKAAIERGPRRNVAKDDIKTARVFYDFDESFAREPLDVYVRAAGAAKTLGSFSGSKIARRVLSHSLTTMKENLEGGTLASAEPLETRKTFVFSLLRRADVLLGLLVASTTGAKALGPDDGEERLKSQAAKLWWSVVNAVRGHEPTWASGQERFVDGSFKRRRAWGFGLHGFGAGGAELPSDVSEVYETDEKAHSMPPPRNEDFDPDVLETKSLEPSASVSQTRRPLARGKERLEAWRIAAGNAPWFPDRSRLPLEVYDGIPPVAPNALVLSFVDDGDVSWRRLESANPRNVLGKIRGEDATWLDEASLFYGDFAKAGFPGESLQEEDNFALDGRVVEAVIEALEKIFGALPGSRHLSRVFLSCLRLAFAARDGGGSCLLALRATAEAVGADLEKLPTLFALLPAPPGVPESLEAWRDAVSGFDAKVGFPRFLRAFESFCLRAEFEGDRDSSLEDFAFDPVSLRAVPTEASFRLRRAEGGWRESRPWGAFSDTADAPRIPTLVKAEPSRLLFSETEEEEEDDDDEEGTRGMTGVPDGARVRIDQVDGLAYLELVWNDVSGRRSSAEARAAEWWADHKVDPSLQREWTAADWRVRFEALLEYRDPVVDPDEEVAAYKSYAVEHVKVVGGRSERRAPFWNIGGELGSHLRGTDPSDAELSEAASPEAAQRMWRRELDATLEPRDDDLPYPSASISESIGGKREWFLRWTLKIPPTRDEIEEPPRWFVAGFHAKGARFRFARRPGTSRHLHSVELDALLWNQADAEGLVRFLEDLSGEVGLVPEDALGGASSDTYVSTFLSAVARDRDGYDPGDVEGFARTFSEHSPPRGLVLSALGPPLPVPMNKEDREGMFGLGTMRGGRFVSAFFEPLKRSSDAAARGDAFGAEAKGANFPFEFFRLGPKPVASFDAGLAELVDAKIAAVFSRRRKDEAGIEGRPQKLPSTAMYAATEPFVAETTPDVSPRWIEGEVQRNISVRRMVRASRRTLRLLDSASSPRERFLLWTATDFVVVGPRLSRVERGTPREARRRKNPSEWADPRDELAEFPTTGYADHVHSELVRHPVGVLGSVPSSPEAYGRGIRARIETYLALSEAEGSAGRDLDDRIEAVFGALLREWRTLGGLSAPTLWKERIVRWRFDALLRPFEVELYYRGDGKRIEKDTERFVERRRTVFDFASSSSTWVASLVEAISLGTSLSRGAEDWMERVPNRTSLQYDGKVLERYGALLSTNEAAAGVYAKKILRDHGADPDEETLDVDVATEELAKKLRANVFVIHVGVSLDGALTLFKTELYGGRNARGRVTRDAEPGMLVDAFVIKIVKRRDDGDFYWHFETLVNRESHPN